MEPINIRTAIIFTGIQVMKRLVGKNTSAYLPVHQHKVLFTSHVDMINQPQLLTGRTLAFENAPSVFNSGFSYRGLIGPHGFWQEWLPSALPDQQYKALKRARPYF
jgi:hypothetical protein